MGCQAMTEPVAAQVIAVLAGMAAITVALRLGGVWVAGAVRQTRQAQAVLDAMTAAVLVAMVLPAALNGDWPVRAALVAAAVTMAATRTMWVAIAVGCATAALVRLATA